MSQGRLQGKVAIIVGAGQMPGDTIGNGRAVADRFAQEGATLLLVDIDEQWAETTRAAVARHGGAASVLRADITREADCTAIAAACIERYGRIDILHNNVGLSRGDRKTVDMAAGVWDELMRQSVTRLHAGQPSASPIHRGVHEISDPSLVEGRIPSWGLTVSLQACQPRRPDTVRSTVRPLGAPLDRVGRRWTLSHCPYSEIGLSWDARKHRGTILDHSHSIVAGGLLDTS